ncbi:MAG: VWA domain-containing protein [Bryobacteraceae bacterium]
MFLPAALLLAAALPIFPQAPAAPPVDDNKQPVIQTTVKVVIAPTTVTNDHGDYIPSLLPRDFSLYDNGKLQRVTQDIAFEPLSLVIAIQASANMEAVLPKIQKIGALLNAQVLGENGEVAILCFDHRIQTLTDFTNNTDQIEAALKKLKPGSTSSRFNDAAMAGVRMLRHQPPDRRRVLLMIGETRDNSSELHPRDILTESEFDNITIYTLNVSHLIAAFTSTAEPPRPPAVPADAQHLPAGVASTPTTQLHNGYANGSVMPAFAEIFRGVKGIFVDNPSELYTKFTGGREYSFVTEKSLERVLQNLGDDLHSQYLLSYTPDNQSEAGFHDIRVTVNRPNLKVRTRPGYWVAAKPE